MNDRHQDTLQQILSIPTAPFHEERVVRWIEGWAARRGVNFSRDEADNVVLRYRRGRRRKRRWLFTAHMDHPGFVVKRRRGRDVWVEFRGSVRKEYFKGASVRLFAPGGEAVGTIVSVREIPETCWFTCRVELGRPAAIEPGTMGMWDLPAYRRRGSRISGRACDDLAGVASVICAMDRLAAERIEADVIGLLTRAEEAGFVGALAACRLGTIPEGALVVGIETSKAQPAGPLGSGVVIRVGDQRRTFDPSLEGLIASVAAGLARKREAFRFTRQLMPGGTCESTVFCAFGHRAAALCLPLGNYHNQGRGGRIRPEQIDAGDFAGLVELLTALAGERRSPADVDAGLRKRLEGILDAREHLLDEEQAP